MNRRIATISLREQRMWMAHFCPHAHSRLTHFRGRAMLVCRGPVQPTPVNQRYQFRMEYSVPRPPRVWIESPALRSRSPNERVPHTFKDGRLCLFRDDFRSDMKLATTIVPWLMYWLFFYEAWLATGVWYGGGIHPGDVRLDEEAA